MAIVLGCVLLLQVDSYILLWAHFSCPASTEHLQSESPGEKHIVPYVSPSVPGVRKDGSAHQVQRVCFLGLPQAALLGSNAILLPPLDFPHVIRRVLGKQGMEMTGASPPLLCFSCRAVGGKGTQQKNITEVHDMGYIPSAQG